MHLRKKPQQGAQQGEEISAKRSHIVYVHGTFAEGTTDKRSDKVSDHDFMQALAERYNATVEQYSWSGSPKDSDRRKASATLAQHLTELHSANPERPLHVFAHSHGGNVLGHALKQMPEESRITSAHLLGTPVTHGPAAWDHSTLDHVSASVHNYFSHYDPVQTTGASTANWWDSSPTKPTQMGHRRDFNTSPGAFGTPSVHNVDLTAHTGYQPTAHSDLHTAKALAGFPATLPSETQRERTTSWLNIDSPPPTAKVFPALNKPVLGQVPPSPIPGRKLKTD